MIEAKGTINGVITSDVSTWHCWGELKAVDYSAAATEPTTDQPASTSTSTLPSLGTRLLKRTSPMMRGDDIAALQSILTTLGFNPGPIDGIFGNKTAAGVRAFQQACGITVDGIVGPVTRARLAERVRETNG